MQTPPHIRHLIEQNHTRRESVLDLRAQSLRQVPEDIRALFYVQQLLLGNNAIQVLPEWLAEMPQLQFIQLNINPLHEVSRVRNLVLDWGVWWRLRGDGRLVDEQVAGL